MTFQCDGDCCHPNAECTSRKGQYTIQLFVVLTNDEVFGPFDSENQAIDWGKNYTNNWFRVRPIKPIA